MNTKSSKKNKTHIEEETTLSKEESVGNNKRLSEQIELSGELFDPKELLGMLENSLSANIITTPSGKLIYCNNAFLEMFDFKNKEEAYNYPLEKLYVSPEQRGNFLAELSKNKKLENFETVHVTAKGRIISALKNMAGIFNEAGELVKIVGNLIDISERKEAELSLKESEEKYRKTFVISPDSVNINRLSDGMYVSINAGFTKIMGFTEDDIIGKTSLEKNIWANAEDRKKLVEGLKKNGFVQNLEAQFRKKNGELVFGLMSASVIDFAGVPHIVSITRDITERKLAEENLAISDKTYRGILNSISEAIYIQDKDGTFIDVNEGAEKMYGYAKEELIGKNPLFVSAEGRNDLQKVTEQINLAFAGEPQTFEFWGKRKNGQIFPKSVSVCKGTYFEKDVIIAVALDISENKKAITALRKSEELFRNLIENISDVFYIADENGRMKYCSPNFFDYTGFTPEEVLGQYYFRVVYLEDRARVIEHYLNATITGVLDTSLELRIQRKNGTVFWSGQSTRIVRDETGKVIQYRTVSRDISLQKQAEEEIKKSELHFRSIWESSANGMRLTDENGTIISVNSAFCKLVKKTKEELEGFHLSVIYSEEKADVVRKNHNEQFSTKTARQFVEKEFTLWNGDKIWFQVVNSFIESEKEKPLLLSIFSDVTKQNIAEAQIKKLSQAVEQSAGSIVITDTDGNIEYVNRKFEEITGYTFKEVEGKNPRLLKSGKTPIEEYENMWNTILAGNEWRGTLQNKKKDGSLYWEAITITPMKNRDGKITNFLSIRDDITLDKIKEEQLAQSELRFRSIWENSLDGMRLADENGIIISVNDAFAKLFEKDKKEIIGNKISVVYGIDSGFNNVESFCFYFKERTISPFMNRAITLWNNKPMFIELSNSFVEIEGQPPLLLSIFRDITEKKQSEQEILIAKEKAEEANKVKTNFLETMSHELRTPMIPILGFTELMFSMELPDEVRNMATMMNKSANRLMDTLNIILDLAQIEKDRVLLKPAKTNISKTIEEVCGLFQPIAKERNLYLRSEVLTDALSITTDERILRHAINNLINNGLKFTQSGGVTIKIASEKTGDECFTIIQVIDTGIGIPKDKQEIIWEEFRQASEGIGRSFEGNGLGLTITKKFVEQLNGKVLVESEVGKGSVFTIKLPCTGSVEEEESAAAKEETAPPPVVLEVAPESTKTLRKVLYVEDEEISFSVVKHFLKNIITLDWARNGQDGVVMAKGNNYEAILMDINLAKGIDGMQTTKLIRELPQYQKTPIIAITAFAMRGDKEEFINAGCSHYISKPFSKVGLINLMSEVLGEKVE